MEWYPEFIFIMLHRYKRCLEMSWHVVIDCFYYFGVILGCGLRILNFSLSIDFSQSEIVFHTQAFVKLGILLDHTDEYLMLNKIKILPGMFSTTATNMFCVLGREILSE